MSVVCPESGREESSGKARVEADSKKEADMLGDDKEHEYEHVT